MKKESVFIFIALVQVLFLMSLINAPSTEVSNYFDCDIYGVCVEEETFDNNTAFVNASNWWITNEGNLDNVDDILHSDLSNLAWGVAGHTGLDLNDIEDVVITGPSDWEFLIFQSPNWINSGDTINETIDFRTASRTFNASQIVTEDGTLDSGDLDSILQLEDGNTYNVSEDAGADPLTININFTNITNFNNIEMSVFYSGGQGHTIHAHLYNFNTGEWEIKHAFTDMFGFTQIVIPVFDASNHIDGTGNVSFRYHHEENGKPSHDLFIDWIVLLEGFSTTTVHQHDALGGRDNNNNHPWALPIDGTRELTGNWNYGSFDINGSGNFNTTANHTGDFGFFNSINITETSYVKDVILEGNISNTENDISIYFENKYFVVEG